MTAIRRSALCGRSLLLGVTGGIAAYKAAELARGLVKAGARVRTVMTPGAREFISPLTFQALTGEPVRADLFDEAHEAAMGHIELARWADLVVVAPASANFCARLAAGMADDLLTTLCLATEARLWLVPAMNQRMWLHPATVDNLARLRERGVSVIDPAIGAQACGDAGPGRMPEPHELLAMLEGALGAGPLAGVRAVVTAGPTREPLDPVRYLGNRSSGRMGYAVASALAAAGASVDLVSGPVGLGDPPGVRCIRIETAAEMRAAVVEVLDGAALFVGCAAVADYRPVEPAGEKIKKDADRLTVELVKNPDILAEVAAARPRPFTVGFAAETTKLREYAEEKRRAKDLDMIAANLVGPGRLGFDTANNALLVLWEGGGAELPVLPKPVLAERLVSLIIERMHAQTAAEDT